MKRYEVLQGNMTKNGHGDLNKVKSFDTFEETCGFMRIIYNDTRGYTKYPNGYLETDIAIVDEDDEDSFTMVDGMVYNY